MSGELGATWRPAALAAAAVLLLAALALPAQEEAPPREPVAEIEGATPDERALIEEILVEDMEARAGEGGVYEPGNRRDPFVPLRRREPVTGVPCEGLACEYIDNIDVTGVFITGDGAVAQVRTTIQKKSYLLRIGDELADGDVVAISSTEIVFRQYVDEPGGEKPFREVIKKLNQ